MSNRKDPEAIVREIKRKPRHLYYTWSKEFLEAGNRRLMGDTKREAWNSAFGPSFSSLPD